MAAVTVAVQELAAEELGKAADRLEGLGHGLV